MVVGGRFTEHKCVVTVNIETGKRCTTAFLESDDEFFPSGSVFTQVTSIIFMCAGVFGGYKTTEFENFTRTLPFLALQRAIFTCLQGFIRRYYWEKNVLYLDDKHFLKNSVQQTFEYSVLRTDKSFQQRFFLPCYRINRSKDG